MTRSMNTMPTHRRGRTHYTPGASDNRGISGICSVLFLFALLLVPPILLMTTETARHGRYVALSYAMDSDIVELNSRHEKIDGDAIANRLAHGTSSDIDTIATDGQVGISIPGALTLRRNTQYCQWSEHQSKQCQRCTRQVTASDGSSKSESYDCNCVTRYDYTKTWRNHRINSLLFDQPAAHHNPMRDPLPSMTFVGDAIVNVGQGHDHDEYNADDRNSNHHHHHSRSRSSTTTSRQRIRLHPDMMTNGIRNQPHRTVEFVPQGRAPPPSLLDRFASRFFGLTRNTRYEPMHLLRDTPHASAATQHNFVYVGQGGYFFSPYESPSTTTTLFKYFMQYMEGSLFDWQLGDLMPSCTAGDIRFVYTVQDPSSISFLGEIVTTGNAGDELLLEMYPKTLVINGNRQDIGFVHAGRHSAEHMISAEDTASRNSALVFRALMLLWSIPASRLLGVGLGREIGESTLSTQIMGTLGLFATLLSGMWFVVWGNDAVGSRDTLLLFVAGGYFTIFALLSSVKRRGRGRLWNAVWCRIGRWANVPPEWRVEDSYIPAPVDDRPASKQM